MGNGAWTKANRVTPGKSVDPPASAIGLVPGPPTCDGPILDPLSIDVAGLDKGAWSVVAVACSLYGETAKERPRDTVQKLLTKASAVCGGDVIFYSAPGGRGRGNVVCLDDDPKKSQASFRLVYSSNSGAKAGSVATALHEAVLNSAVKNEAAVAGNLVAASVRTRGVLEGVLLVDRPPTLESTAGDSGSTSQDSGHTGCLMGVRLWAFMLGERMERLHWRQEALESVQALNSVLDTMEKVVAHDDPDEIIDCARTMIPQSLLQGRVSSDTLALWFYDNGRRELVLNNSGALDGVRVPADNTIIGETVLRGTEEIISVNDVKKCPNYNRLLDEKSGFSTQSIMCVPISRPKHKKKAIPDDSNCGSAVVQFKNCRKDHMPKGQDLAHFDLVGAEALQRSALGTLMWLRDFFMQMLASQQQRAALQVVLSRLQGAQNVKDIVRLVEHDVIDAMDCEACTLFFIDDTSKEVWAPPTASLPKGINITIGEGLVGHVVAEARQSTNPGVDDILVVNDPASCPHWKGDVCQDFHTRNIMTAPVRSTEGDQRPLGVIQILNKRTAQFGPTSSVKFAAFSTNASFGVNSFNFNKPVEDDEVSAVKNFTATDAKLLDVLCQAIGNHMQRMQLEIMWTKTRLDTASRSGENEETPLIVQEFYTQGQGLRRDAVAASRQSQFFASPQKHRTVHRANTRMDCRLSVDLNLVEEELLDDMLKNSPTQSQADVSNWSIDYFNLDQAAQFGLILQSLRYHECFSTISVERSVLYNFFSEVKGSYRAMPYHNFSHALATVHYVFKLLQAADVSKYLTKIDLFAIVIAALCHDCDHRGRNNAFEIMTRSELALRYNDSSPLENHHCARAFEIAFRTDHDASSNYCDIFANLSGDIYKAVRERMVAGILSTDMKHHGHHVELLQTFQPDYGKNSAQSQFLVELFLHSADISNPLMPEEVSLKWSEAIAEEFSDQVGEERNLGLPVTSFMDNQSNDPIALAKSQLGFINFVIHPLVDPLFRIFPGLVQPKAFLQKNAELHTAIVEKSIAERRRSKDGAPAEE